MKKAPDGKIADGKKAKPTGADTVLSIIKRSKKGIDTDGLKKKTGFEGRKAGDIIYRLKKQGKIRPNSFISGGSVRSSDCKERAREAYGCLRSEYVILFTNQGTKQGVE